jgi:prefoldin subunit 5
MSAPQEIERAPANNKAKNEILMTIATGVTAIAAAKNKPKNEILITIATGLAAIAAVGSAVAAFRQEKATFTTNLYSKQVDSVNSMLTELLRIGYNLQTLEDKVSGSPGHKGSDPRSVDLSSPEIKELNEFQSNISGYGKVLLTGNVAIMPDAVVNEVGKSIEDLMDVIELLPTAFGSSSRQEGLQKYRQKTEVYFCDIARIRFCTSEQFQEGMTLRDDAFTACVPKYKSSHKSRCL